VSIPEQRYAVPSHPTVQRKMDLVDREGLEDVRCDLDYVPPVGFPEHPGRSIFIASFTVATASTALTWAVGHYVLPLVMSLAPMIYVLPGVVILSLIAAVDSTKTLEENLIRTLRNAWLSVWAFMAVAAIPSLLHPEVATFWLLLVALPVVVYFAHRFTTFCVYWITAHPLGDGLTMLRCRDIWEHRWEGVPTSVPESIRENRRDAAHWAKMLHAVRFHDFGSLWCCVAVLAGLAMAWFTCAEKHLSTIGLQSTVSVLLALFAAALIRCEGRLPLRLLGRMLLDWLYYDVDGQATPWMFQSPCGDTASRSRWAFATIGVMAVAINNLASGYAHIVVPVSRTAAVFRPDMLQPILALLVAAVFCVAVPLAVLGLLLSIIAGPVLRAFDGLYSTH